MKKIIALLLTLALFAATFSGCGSSADPNSQPAASTQADSEDKNVKLEEQPIPEHYTSISFELLGTVDCDLDGKIPSEIIGHCLDALVQSAPDPSGAVKKYYERTLYPLDGEGDPVDCFDCSLLSEKV